MGSDDADAEAAAAELALRLQAKAVRRKRARALRNTIPQSALAARSAAIVARLLSRQEVNAAGTVALFWPILERNEVDLRALDAELRARRKRIAYPSIDAETREMRFRWVEGAEAMSERGLGFLDPGPDAPEVDRLDLIVVPALEVDTRGHRLGYGAGFYDRALPRYRPPARAVAVAYDFQLVTDLPDTPGDVPVDAIVTDRRALFVS